ncbi:MAG: division/cell wall cluster transcriptional repressor MraZ [Clostridia bacterium]|nr:division/cell wall cluster transcriptional repressor MraZ [Clostridia bacterium]MBQ3553606.1 division/cell wall cluster transcriptional repressor MraZ [Clostridia bacterium]
MLMGEYQHSLDNKGRMFMPSKFREELGDTVIVTLGLDNCLFAFPLDEFEKLKNKLDSLPLSNKDARQFVRFFFAGACECETDKQGRIMIPAKLRSYAGLEKEVTVVGASTRLEIWDSKKWDDDYSFDHFSPDVLSEKLEGLL